MAKKELLVGWLKDAHGMEQAQQQTLERFSKEFEEYPHIQDRLNEHLKITERQADDLQLCLQRLDEDTSAIKSATGSVAGAIQGIMSAPFKDDLVKNMISMHASEHFEHASYLSLAAAARECGEDEIAEAVEQIAEEELTMADWAEEQIPIVTAEVMKKEG